MRLISPEIVICFQENVILTACLSSRSMPYKLLGYNTMDSPVIAMLADDKRVPQDVQANGL